MTRRVFAAILTASLLAGVVAGLSHREPSDLAKFGATYHAAHSHPRSSQWPAVRIAHLKVEPACAFCGRTEDLQVHHVVPFHIDPSKELDPGNLITLCGHGGHNCHLVWGHLGSYERSNPDVRKHATMYREAQRRAKTRAGQ